MNLDCAQCHDHPFARWTRDQLWQTAAFFTRPVPDGKPVRFEIALPGGKKSVGPKLLEGPPPEWPAEPKAGTARALLANWVTAKGNPYFARNAVNRAWAHMFGTGLVEPLDDLSGQAPASHPKLLDELAEAFADNGYDLRFLYAVLVRTEVYQLSSRGPKGPAVDPRLYSHAAVRGLTGEQLYDSLRTAAGLTEERTDLDPPKADGRKRFADQFRVERTGAAQRSILQALALMNNPQTGQLTDPTRTPTLAAASAPFLDAGGRVEALFLATYNRKPSADELTAFKPFVDGPAQLVDLFWGLLNSAEFNTNH